MNSFWKDKKAWKKACYNTFHCLIGCSIGDFGMLIFIQIYVPSTPLWLRMILAMTSGICTSILLESIILRIKESFAWPLAFKTAISMSFLSMLAMEFAENMTDFFLTKGTTPVHDPWFWIALALSLIPGYLTPLPYNYYQVKRHQKSCH